MTSGSEGRAERESFEALVSPHEAAMRSLVHRMVGLREDAEDLIQDILLRAFESKASLRDESSARSWLLRIATHRCIDHLRHSTRWRPFSQRYIEDSCHEDDAKRERVFQAVIDPAFAYDVREHLAFCFTCVGRSLEPRQQAAILLREVLDLKNREAAKVLELTESVYRRELAAGRAQMEATFEGLCSLVNKEGVCRQCASFRSTTAEERRGPSLPVLDRPDTSWQARCDAVASKSVEGGVSESLHDLLFELIDELESSYAK